MGKCLEQRVARSCGFQTTAWRPERAGGWRACPGSSREQPACAPSSAGAILLKEWGVDLIRCQQKTFDRRSRCRSRPSPPTPAPGEEGEGVPIREGGFERTFQSGLCLGAVRGGTAGQEDSVWERRDSLSFLCFQVRDLQISVDRIGDLL